MFKHKTIKTRSLKKYTADNFYDKLNVNFPNLVKQFPIAALKYGMDFVRNFYKNIDLPDGPFGFSHVYENKL